METEINEATPVAMCTLGQLVDYLRDSGFVISTPSQNADSQVKEKMEKEGVVEDIVVARPFAFSQLSNSRKIYGIDGIMKEFKVGRNKAFMYKRKIFRNSILQEGRSIVIDADMAWREYEAYCNQQKTTKSSRSAS